MFRLQVLTVRSRLAETREELRGQDPDVMEVLGHLWPTLAVVGGVSKRSAVPLKRTPQNQKWGLV